LIRFLALAFALAAGSACAGAVLRIDAQDTTMELASGDIAGAAVTETLNETPAVTLRLAPDGTRTFAAVTEAAIGRPVRISLCGRVRAEPVVQAAIAGGTVILPLDSFEEAEEIAAILRGDKECPDG